MKLSDLKSNHRILARHKVIGLNSNAQAFVDTNRDSYLNLDDNRDSTEPVLNIKFHQIQEYLTANEEEVITPDFPGGDLQLMTSNWPQKGEATFTPTEETLSDLVPELNPFKGADNADQISWAIAVDPSMDNKHSASLFIIAPKDA